MLTACEILSFAVLGIKSWLKEDGNLHTGRLQYSFEFVHSKVQTLFKMLSYFTITLPGT